MGKKKKNGKKMQTQSVGSVVAAAAPLIKEVAISAAKKASGVAAPYVSKLASTMKKFATSEEQHLYGFLDPENGRQGPGDGQSATSVVVCRSYNDFILQETPLNEKTGLNYNMLATNHWTMADAGQHLGADSYTMYQDNVAYREADGGEITFVACPHIPRSFRGMTPFNGTTDPGNIATFVSRFASGFQCSNVTYAQAMYSNTWIDNPQSGGATNTVQGSFMKPMANYDIDVFTNRQQVAVVQKVPEDPATTEQTVQHPVRYRFVGLKLSVVCNSPALTVQGQVVGGDNRFLFGVQPETVAHEDTVGGSTSSADIVFDNFFSADENVFRGKTMSQSRTDLGALSHGQTYESVFIPASDHISKWSTLPAARAALVGFGNSVNDVYSNAIHGGYQLDSAHFAYQTMIDAVMNMPMAYITIIGAEKKTTFRVYTTCAFEYCVLNDGPLALLRESARLNKRFQPDWGELYPIAGACCGCCHNVGKAVQKSTCLANGMAAAAKMIPSEVGWKTNPNTYSIGATNAVVTIGNEVDTILRSVPPKLTPPNTVIGAPSATAPSVAPRPEVQPSLVGTPGQYLGLISQGKGVNKSNWARGGLGFRP